MTARSRAIPVDRLARVSADPTTGLPYPDTRLALTTTRGHSIATRL